MTVTRAATAGLDSLSRNFWDIAACVAEGATLFIPELRGLPFFNLHKCTKRLVSVRDAASLPRAISTAKDLITKTPGTLYKYRHTFTNCREFSIGMKVVQLVGLIGFGVSWIGSVGLLPLAAGALSIFSTVGFGALAFGMVVKSVNLICKFAETKQAKDLIKIIATVTLAAFAIIGLLAIPALNTAMWVLSAVSVVAFTASYFWKRFKLPEKGAMNLEELD